MAAKEEGEKQTSHNTISIDEEEFTRLQTQLIELRTINYELKEENSKRESAHQQLLLSNQNLTKELDKANKSLQKNKKAKEFQVLLEENESLVQQLHTQEENFKLQNKTLMDELGKVNEELDSLKRATNSGPSQELTQLQTENIALQRSLKILQEQLQSNEGGEGGGKGDGSPVIDVHVTTLSEEKRALQEKLAQEEERGRKESESFKADKQKLEDKLSKKQETLRQLQDEKELLLKEKQEVYDEMRQKKDKEIAALHSEVKLLKEESDRRQKDSDANNDLVHQISLLRTEKEELVLKCRHLTEHQESISKEHDSSKTLLDELGQELQQSKGELGEMKRHCHTMEEQLKASQQANDDLADQLLSSREEKLKLESTIASIEKLAEKRKTLLDEMAIKEQQRATEQKKKETELTESYQKRIDSLEEELNRERSQVQNLSSSLEEKADLQRRIKSMENMREMYEEQLRVAKELADKEKEELSLRLSELESTSQEERGQLVAEKEEEKKKRQELELRISELENELDEKSQEILITGKKSSTLIKDLKRQLQQIQKREEKLQEQLSSASRFELPLNSNTSSIGTPSFHRDHSRESSLSSHDVLAASTSHQGSHDAADGGGANKEDVQTLLDKIASLQQEKWLLEEKVNHLETTSASLAEDVVQKAAIIQGYFMENKADHTLSVPSSQSAASKMSPLRLVQWAKAQGSGKEETMAEINRKMQRALEESLMKNIHLQQNVDMLSSELQKQEEDSNREEDIDHRTTKEDTATR